MAVILLKQIIYQDFDFNNQRPTLNAVEVNNNNKVTDTNVFSKDHLGNIHFDVFDDKRFKEHTMETDANEEFDYKDLKHDARRKKKDKGKGGGKNRDFFGEMGDAFKKGFTKGIKDGTRAVVTNEIENAVEHAKYKFKSSNYNYGKMVPLAGWVYEEVRNQNKYGPMMATYYADDRYGGQGLKYDGRPTLHVPSSRGRPRGHFERVPSVHKQTLHHIIINI